MEKVFLSKPSVLCAAGSSCEELWQNVISGNQKGIVCVGAINGKTFYAGRIKDELLQKKASGPYDMRILRIEERCLSGLEEAVEKAKKLYSVSRIGVCTGSCDNGTELSVKGHAEYFKSGCFPENYSLEIQSADYVSTYAAEKFGVKGPVMTFSTACSSSAGAIVKAAQLIKSGICDAVIAGGVDIAGDTVLMGFDSLEAVSSEITNPFSRNRHGITPGEAAAFFVLSKDVLDASYSDVELAGYGESADAFHMTSPDPEGNGAFRAMIQALESADLKPENVSYVNLHGTGTKFNDSMEAKAVYKVFGSYKVPVSSTKPMTGHTLGASGALEAAVSWLTITQNQDKAEKFFPVQVWDGIRDEEIPELNFQDKNNRSDLKEVKVVMSNSFAFGGANSCLILEKR